MKLGVILAMALATLAVADSASARHRSIGVGKSAAHKSLTLRKATPPLKVSPKTAPTTKGIIMRDGGVCDPIRHMGC